MLNIEIIPCLNDNYSYLLCDKSTNSVAIIDPSDFNPCDKIINKKFFKDKIKLNNMDISKDSIKEGIKVNIMVDIKNFQTNIRIFNCTFHKPRRFQKVMN